MSDGSVTVVSVSYNSAIPLQGMLCTIPKGTPVIVVDNASEDDSVEVAKRSGATVIVNEQNVGFGNACNIGARAAQSEYLFFLNPDTELEPDTIDSLLLATERYPFASALSPVLLSQSRVPTLMHKSILVPEKRWLPKELPDSDFEVPAISGAAIFISRRKFNEVGEFDKNIFYYHEDDDLCLRLRRQFGPIMIVHSAHLMHLGSQSVSTNSQLGGFKCFHFHKSRMYVVRKHGVPFPVKRKIYELSLNFLLSCLFFRRKYQIKYYYSLLGMLSVEGKEKYKMIDFVLSRMARAYKVDSLYQLD
ncbi:MAG: glycosyltransferase family 2 protein [Acidiferrobacterales bacterium]|nr:glycosyltransferase family 2 protein [Acidiferrobacterales bacterium]